MEESGSEGLDDILERHKDSFLKDVDFTCISDNYWLGRSKPCITYGLRGICYYAVEIKGPKQDLHSGVFGNTIHEPLSDLVWILGQLASVDGQILIEGISDIVAPVTAEEHAVYESIDFSMDDYKEEIGVKQLVTESKKELLMNRWRFPSLSVHGIEGAFSGPGSKTVIPAKVTGKFSIRLVPNMEPEKVDELVFEYLNKLWAQRGSSNTMKPVSLSGARPWVADFKHPNYQAAARAIEQGRFLILILHASRRMRNHVARIAK
ncbi:Protein Y71H2AM.11 [Aphelenchoides avenae]|nr:Protein Y71H2AM.11 [Aphelenchus avenae]